MCKFKWRLRQLHQHQIALALICEVQIRLLHRLGDDTR